MASLYRRKNSQYFWLQFRDANGIVRRISTRYKIGFAQDVRRARQLEAEKSLEELKDRPPARNEGWGWVPDFLSVHYHASKTSLERYLSAWTTLRMFLDEHKIDSPNRLRRKHCLDYVVWRRTPDKAKGKYQAKHNTALLELKTLRLIMQEALEREMIVGNPCVKLGIKKEKPVAKPELTDDDCRIIREGIKAVANPIERDMLSNSFEIARFQGCRLSETRLDPVKDVDFDNMTIHFRTAKGGKYFVTALHPALVPLFTRLRAAGRTSTWEIPEGRGRQWASSRWWKFLDSLGLKARGITFHSTRVTVITELVRSGVHESKVLGYVGHSSTTTSRIYQRLQPKDFSDCVAAVGRRPVKKS